jgi:hypothetical protein
MGGACSALIKRQDYAPGHTRADNPAHGVEALAQIGCALEYGYVYQDWIGRDKGTFVIHNIQWVPCACGCINISRIPDSV